MASSLLSILTLLFHFSLLRLSSSSQSQTPSKEPFLALPLVSRPQSHPQHPSISPLQISLLDPKTRPRPPSSTKAQQGQSPQGPPFKFPFKYTMALVVSLPIGTPSQAQSMVLDTGSQLSWVQCHNRPPLSPHSRNPSSLKTPPANTPKTPTPTPSSTTFDPSLSSSFSLLPCNTPSCNPRTPDFTLPTSCDSNRLCHYSYFYADGTLAEGNLVQEKISLSPSSTPPIVLGCSHADASASSSEGILGLNLGRLSFVSQASVRKFSYCVPTRRRNLTEAGAAAAAPAVGTFLLGENPFSGGFRYAGLLRFTPEQRRLPNLDASAFSVAVAGVRVNGRRLPIPRSAFVPDAGGSGQTMVDSGTEFTFLVEAAYAEVRAAAARLAGLRFKKDYVYGGALDTCFQGRAAEIGRLVWEVAIEMDGGADLVTAGERALVEVGGGVSCLAIGSSQLLGVPSNIIGNFHQQNMWVEFDVLNNRVGFGKADCTKPL